MPSSSDVVNSYPARPIGRTFERLPRGGPPLRTLILVDEPTGNVDTKTGSRVLDRFDELPLDTVHEFSGFEPIVEWERSYMPASEQEKYEDSVGKR